MKAIIFVLVLVASFSSFAATSKQINSASQKLFLKSLPSLELQSAEGIPRDQMIAHMNLKYTKLSTSCAYDAGDSLYNCTTAAINGRSEMALFFNYQLEGKKGKIPTEFVFLTVIVNAAG